MQAVSCTVAWVEPYELGCACAAHLRSGMYRATSSFRNHRANPGGIPNDNMPQPHDCEAASSSGVSCSTAPAVQRLSGNKPVYQALPSTDPGLAGPSATPCTSNGEAAHSNKICRICFDSEDPIGDADNPLISPCLCAGGSKYVHRKCLQMWRETSKGTARSHAYYRCEVCHFEYRYARLDAAAFLAHPVVVILVFLLLLAGSCFLGGFVPIIQACLRAGNVDFSSHRWLVHALDGVLVVGLLGFTGLVVDACSTGTCRGMDACPACYIWPADCCAPCCLDCGAMDCAGAAGACGEFGLVLVLLAMAAAAVFGLAVAIPLAFRWLYDKCNALAGATVAMVENIQTGAKQG